MRHASASSGDVAAWEALPFEHGDQGKQIVTATDVAARRFAAASSGKDEAILAALAQVETALSSLDACLGRCNENRGRAAKHGPKKSCRRSDRVRLTFF
jgi:hypothetical protein